MRSVWADCQCEVRQNLIKVNSAGPGGDTGTCSSGSYWAGGSSPSICFLPWRWEGQQRPSWADARVVRRAEP